MTVLAFMRRVAKHAQVKQMVPEPFVDNDSDDDGVCDADEVALPRLSACNYNAAATDDDSSCVYATGCETCSGETDGTGTIVDNDSDDDGVCDADEVAGCQDASACNYNTAATDDDSVRLLTECETCWVKQMVLVPSLITIPMTTVSATLMR